MYAPFSHCLTIHCCRVKNHHSGHDNLKGYFQLLINIGIFCCYRHVCCDILHLLNWRSWSFFYCTYIIRLVLLIVFFFIALVRLVSLIVFFFFSIALIRLGLLIVFFFSALIRLVLLMVFLLHLYDWYCWSFYYYYYYCTYTAGVVDLYFSCIYTAGIVDVYFFYCTYTTGIVDRFFFLLSLCT